VEAGVDSYITDLEQLSVFDAAAALVFARPYGYTEANAELLWEFVCRRTDASGLPVLANVELGNADPIADAARTRPAANFVLSPS
jgi:muramoyltetrapeptide carboxypeptidase LdcA involved in peptidoglycan recycling